MQITSEPLCSDPCARLKIQIPMHSISWGCPKIVRHCDPISLLINTFGIHLEPGCKSHEQIIHYRTAKNVKKQATVLLYFETNSYQVIRKGFPVVWPVTTKMSACLFPLGEPDVTTKMSSCLFPVGQWDGTTNIVYVSVPNETIRRNDKDVYAHRVGQSDVTINMGTYCLFPVGKSHVATNIHT